MNVKYVVVKFSLWMENYALCSSVAVNDVSFLTINFGINF
jgi:hypothetical protein